MKRFVLFALPMLATIVVLGLGFLVIRRDGPAIAPRIAAARKALQGAVEAVVEVEEEDE
jgi:hypothetical protein